MSKGVVLTNKGNYCRSILTTSGELNYTRTMLVPRTREDMAILMNKTGQKSIFPLDCLLKTDKVPFKMTYKMMSVIAKAAVRSKSYVEAATVLRETMHISISSVQVEKVTDYVGSIIYAIQCQEAEDARNALGSKVDKRKRRRRKNDILYLETDGAMVYLRDKEKGKPGWTESKHAVAFNSSDIRRFYDEKGKETGHRILEREYVGYIGSSEEFTFHFLALAKKNECDLCSELVVISDGAPWIHSMVKNYLPGATHILDLYHAKENAGKFAKYIKSSPSEQNKYGNKLCKLIEDGKINKLLKHLEQYKDTATPDGVPNLYTYIYNHKDCMNYPDYVSRGYFVGSGAIESANRSIMQNRLKLPGMRWKRVCGRGMLSLKTKYEAGKWADVEAELSKRFE